MPNGGPGNPGPPFLPRGEVNVMGANPLFQSRWIATLVSSGGKVLRHCVGGNTLHSEGEEFLLKRAFTDSVELPESFFVGLDARKELDPYDTLETVSSAEPDTSSGYSRVAVDFNTGESIYACAGQWRAVCNGTFQNPPAGSTWVVRNAFLATTPDASGKLIYSRLLLVGDQPWVIKPGDSLIVTTLIDISEQN